MNRIDKNKYESIYMFDKYNRIIEVIVAKDTPKDIIDDFYKGWVEDVDILKKNTISKIFGELKFILDCWTGSNINKDYNEIKKSLREACNSCIRENQNNKENIIKLFDEVETMLFIVCVDKYKNYPHIISDKRSVEGIIKHTRTDLLFHKAKNIGILNPKDTLEIFNEKYKSLIESICSELIKIP